MAKNLAEFLTHAEDAKASNTNNKALSYIQLACEDGPLLYISNIDNLIDAQKYLECLFTPRGFSSEFILFKEFFGATLDSIGKVEDYLAIIKRVSTNLKAKNLELLNKLIIAWTLHNLGAGFEAFVASVTQSYRAELVEINIDDLFADLIDKSRRLESVEESALITRKALRAKYKDYGKTGYAIETCYKLYPELRPRPRSDGASPVTDVLIAIYSDLPVAAHSDFLYSARPVASRDLFNNPHGDSLMASHSGITSPYGVSFMASHSGNSMGGPALSAKHSSSPHSGLLIAPHSGIIDWIQDLPNKYSANYRRKQGLFYLLFKYG